MIAISFMYVIGDILWRNNLTSNAAGSISAILLPDRDPIIPNTLPNEGTRMAITAVSNIQNIRIVAILKPFNINVVFSEHESGITNNTSNISNSGLENKVCDTNREKHKQAVMAIGNSLPEGRFNVITSLVVAPYAR